MSRKTKTVGVVDALDAKQLQAIDLLASGHTVTDAAETVGVERETVSRWKTTDPFFMMTLSERQAMLWDASADKLRSNMVAAADRLGELIAHDDPHVALKAIAVVFKSTDIYPKKGRAIHKGVNDIRRDMDFRNF